MKSVVYNNSIVSSAFLEIKPTYTIAQKQELFARLFEQLLLFDTIVLCIDKDNFPLQFLIANLGIDTVERLIRSGYIKFSIKSSAIFTGKGMSQENGTLDSSTIYGKPPIIGGALTDKDLNPEFNVHKGLLPFNLDKRTQRRLIKNITVGYIETDNLELSINVVDFIIQSYTNNLFENLGLPFHKDPLDLNLDEREKLLELGNSVLEMATISKNGFKSYDNYAQLEIAKKTYQNIGKAYKVSEGASEILRIENTPNLTEIYFLNRFEISDIFKLRHLPSAKYFRKWINTVGENANCKELTEAYIAEIRGHKKFFGTPKGKLLKNTLLYGATSGLGGLIGGALGAAVALPFKPAVELAVDYGLGLIEEFTVDSIFAGKDPKIFIDGLKEEVKQ